MSFCVNHCVNMRNLPSLNSSRHVGRGIWLVAALLLAHGQTGTAQTVITNFKIWESQPAPPAATRGRFDDRADVRLDSQRTNDIMIVVDRPLADAVRKRWRQLLGQRYERPPTASVTLEFQIHSDGRVTDLRTVGEPSDKVFALLAQKAVLDPAPYGKWDGGNKHHLVRLRFSCRAQPK